MRPLAHCTNYQCGKWLRVMWTTFTAAAPILEVLRRRLRDLVKLIESKVRNIIYSDFEDENSLLSLSHL